MPINRPKPLFKVALEFNRSTQSIIDTLADNGFTAYNRPNFKILPEMYEVLDRVYGEDKARSQDHERAKEEYESRRSHMMNQRNDSITLDNMLEPLDALKPIAESSEPGKSILMSGLEPITETKPIEAEVEIEEVAEIEEPEVTEVIDKEEEIEVEVEVKVKEEVIEAEESSEEVVEEEPETEKIPKKIIRGKADKLKGTKVLGKTAFTNDLTSDSKVRKKRKRKKDQPSFNPEEKKQGQARKEHPKKQTPIKETPKKKEKTDVDVNDVDRMMRETLKKMQGNSTIGTKRGKRRRQRKEEREEELQQMQEMESLESNVIEVAEFITANDLAEELEVGVNDIISACMSIGLMITINQRLDAGTIELIAGEFGKDVKFIDAEELVEELVIEEDNEKDLKPRAPIITVMGHVDHGKTSLLDYIREAKVAEGEAGGITQHVGAYEVNHQGGKITFLDTPGHEAFTAMRSRGAHATDIVILVVAADDSVMPQTIEAINHAKAAGVPIVVAINKMDKEGASPDKIKQELTNYDVIVEEWGGTAQFSLVSAKTGMGIDDLLEKVLIEAELLDLKANPNRRADGIVLEARLDKGKGIVANILVQNGTLNVGDPFVAGPCFGRIRAMEDDRGKRIKKADPATPVQLTGFVEMPQAGDKVVVTVDEKTAKEVANQRQQIRREQSMRKAKHMTLDDLSRTPCSWRSF